MKIEILFKDNSTLDISNVKRVCNASSNIPNDWLYIYSIGDICGKPSTRIEMSKITCFDVRES